MRRLAAVTEAYYNYEFYTLSDSRYFTRMDGVMLQGSWYVAADALNGHHGGETYPPPYCHATE